LVSFQEKNGNGMVTKYAPKASSSQPALAVVICQAHPWDRERERQSLAVWASGPTARPAHATAHLINSNLDAALSGGFLLGRGHPTDPLVTRQRGNVGPKVRDCGIQLDRLSEICRQLVNCAVREFWSGHGSKRARFA
jgi:hypothetical protein